MSEHARLFCGVIDGLGFPFSLDEEYFCPLGVLVGDLAHVLEASQRCRGKTGPIKSV